MASCPMAAPASSRKPRPEAGADNVPHEKILCFEHSCQNDRNGFIRTDPALDSYLNGNSLLMAFRFGSSGV